MTQLRKNHLDYYYTKDDKGKEVQRSFLNKRAAVTAQRSGVAVNVWPYAPNGEFPLLRHDRRGFLPKKGKKRNTTHARLKRRNKARLRMHKR